MIYLPIESVEQNTGQIEGLPSNPRQWTQTDINRLAKSLEETPELFEARPLIVYPHADKYVILGGNLRYEGAKKNGMQDVPAHILDAELDIDKLKEIVIKDNGSFGDWDMDMLANEWDDLPLREWGIDMPDWGTVNVGEQEDTAHKDEMDKGYNIQYVMVFNSEDEQDRWYSFLEILKRKYPDVDTIAERVLLETDEIVRNAN